HPGIEVLGVDGVDVRAGGPTSLCNEVVLGGVHCDAMQPCVELRVATEAADGAVGADERLLRHVLALRPVGDVAAHEGEDAVMVPANEDIARCAAALVHTLYHLLHPCVPGHAAAVAPSGSAVAEQWTTLAGESSNGCRLWGGRRAVQAPAVMVPI